MARRDLCSADIQDRTNSRGLSNHEWTQIDANKGRTFVSIRGCFSSPLVAAPPRCVLLLLNIESKLHYVAVFDDILFALDTQFSGFTSLGE